MRQTVDRAPEHVYPQTLPIIRNSKPLHPGPPTPAAGNPPPTTSSCSTFRAIHSQPTELRKSMCGKRRYKLADPPATRKRDSSAKSMASNETVPKRTSRRSFTYFVRGDAGLALARPNQTMRVACQVNLEVQAKGPRGRLGFNFRGDFEIKQCAKCVCVCVLVAANLL